MILQTTVFMPNSATQETTQGRLERLSGPEAAAGAEET